MSRLPKTIYLAEKVGKELGSGEILQRKMPKK
jgi:hypothetical protein